jgi:LysM repeat protein
MEPPESRPEPLPEADASVAARADQTALEASTLIAVGACPFLVAVGGAWRMSVPDREHRCAAFNPATSLALSKQARLCLTPSHAGCATYVASTRAREARVGRAGVEGRTGRWGLARTTPVVEEVGGLRATLGALVADRRTWPAVPAVLLGTLGLALGLSGTWGEAPVTAIGSPSPSARAVETRPPSAAPSTPSQTEVPATLVPSPSVEVTQAPTPTPSPSVAYRTYRVQSGDTLYVIARQFGTTVKAIQKLNGLTSTTIHAGQVLKIPTS